MGHCQRHSTIIELLDNQSFGDHELESKVLGHVANIYWTPRFMGLQSISRKKWTTSQTHIGRCGPKRSGTSRQPTLQGFIVRRIEAVAPLYMVDLVAYQSLPRRRQSVKHSAGRYVDGAARTNGIESFCAMLKRGYKGIHHWMNQKHLNRYVQEVAGLHKVRASSRSTRYRLSLSGSREGGCGIGIWCVNYSAFRVEQVFLTRVCTHQN